MEEETGMIAAITPINIIRLAAAIGLVSIAVILSTAYHQGDLQGLKVPNRIWWQLYKTYAYVGMATILMVSVEYMITAGTYGIKVMRTGRF
jgi:hypothetical protein